MAGVTTPEGIVIPAGGDTYDYTGEQRRMAASQRTVVTVADRTAADLIATNMASDGRPVTDANPLHVFRLDLQRYEAKIAAGWVWGPAGIVSYTEMTSNSGTLTGAVTVIKNIPSFTFVAGRSYKLTTEVGYMLSATGSTWAWQFGTCSTADSAPLTTGITPIMAWTDQVNGASEGRRFGMSRIYKPGAQTVQLKLTGQRVTGAANATVLGSANDPVFMLVEDLGVTQGVY
jgi:hypothetical protein